MRNFLRSILPGRKKASLAPQRERLFRSKTPAAVYAIGDIHGRLDLLLDLEQKIIADSQDFPGEKLIVILGDFIDRGPKSAHVLDHLIAQAPEGFERICLCGNHEELMTQYLESPRLMRRWLHFGGFETLLSYGITPDPERGLDLPPKQLGYILDANIPKTHREFLTHLPCSLEMEDVYFTHAGIDPTRSLEAQEDEDLMWISTRFLDYSGPFEKTIVHGHTPVKEIDLTQGRINVDTGAYISNVLSAIRIAPEKTPEIIQSRKPY